MVVDPRFDYGEMAPWLRRDAPGVVSAIGGDDALVISGDVPLEPGDDHGLSGTVTVRAGERARLCIEFVRPETIDPGPADGRTAQEVDEQLARTLRWWADWARTETEVADAPLVMRSALILKGLIDPATGAMAAAATTSLPEAVGAARNWDYRYSWIRDSAFAVRSLAEVGFAEEADAFRRFVQRSAAGQAHELQIAYGLGGERRLAEAELCHLEGYRGSQPVRVGNAAAGQLQLDSIGELVNLTWRWHRRGQSPDDDHWRFLASLVELAAERWREPDRGLWEWRGEPLHFVHSKAMCWAALDRGLALAEECMRRVPKRRWQAARDELREAIDDEGYDSARGVFIQAFGHAEMDAALLLLPSFDFVAWDDPRMVRTVDAVRDELGAGDGLLYRYRRDDGLGGDEGAFLPCTFWLAECLARQGRLAEAHRTFDAGCATANDLGIFSEERDPRSGEALGNLPQALTHLSHIGAAVALAPENTSAMSASVRPGPAAIDRARTRA